MTNPAHELIDNAIARQEWNLAMMRLKQYFRESPNLASAQFVSDRMKRIGGSTNLPCRMAIVRSFTLEPVILLLQALALLHGIDVTVQVGNFNTYAQDMLDPGSNLYQFDPQIVILAVQTRDLVPDLWCRYTEMPATEVKRIVDQTLINLNTWISTFRSRSQAHLILHTLELPPMPNAGILDGQTEHNQAEAIQAVNRELRRMVSKHTGVYVLDYEALVSRFGRVRWHDECKWLTMRMPIAADCLIHLAKEYLRFLLPVMGRVCKALVVDLDNTLWGGVIGEDGLHGIQLGTEYPGAAYLELQRVILDLYHRGIILAVCSKNNMDDAMEVLQQHPSMLLRPQHFAALRINWNSKVKNLEDIAAELNIGIDALAFLDDNPRECEQVRSELSEVYVIDLPSDPMRYAQALRECPVFERLTLSSEDQNRVRYYVEQRQRKELQERTGSLEDFYRSLEMEVEITEASPELFPRISQLTQKTNQFNLTTHRYSEQQIAAMARDTHWHIYTLRVRDRFGDNGLVGVAITCVSGDICEIDTFLLSCRVIGRTVETALLAYLSRKAVEEGVRFLRGWYLPTKKNLPARDFYPSHNFQLIREEDSRMLWDLDLPGKHIDCPEWIISKS